MTNQTKMNSKMTQPLAALLTLAVLAFVGLAGCSGAMEEPEGASSGSHELNKSDGDWNPKGDESTEGGKTGEASEGSTGSYDPCGGKTCGERCTVCAPGDTDCAETDVLKYCQADGTCSANQPQCKGNGGNGGSGSYDPCGGKTCGASCTKCAPGDKDCVETSVLKYCQADGTCSANQPQCKGNGGSGGNGSYDPCAGKTCGDKCTLCAPGDTDCVETQEIKVCHADGTCSGGTPQCK